MQNAIVLCLSNSQHTFQEEFAPVNKGLCQNVQYLTVWFGINEHFRTIHTTVQCNL